MTDAYAAIAVGRPVRGEFTYLHPASLGPLVSGQRVLVPFGRATALGFYLGPATPPPATMKVRPIEKALEPDAALPPDLIALLRFAAEHYRYPLGEAIRSALPPGLSGKVEGKIARPNEIHFAVVEDGADPARLSRAPSQAAVLSYLLAVGGRATVEEVAHAIPGARESLKKLVERKLCRIESEEVKATVRAGLEAGQHLALTPEQTVAVAALEGALSEGGFKPFLLHGVTGSGKTEVYLRAMEHALSLGKGGLILVPEIALTPQLVGRFRSRFGQRVGVLHSGLKDRERLHQWQALRRGDIQIAVGVRSALFAPVENLGLVVVDEEHDPSFKQEEKLRYHARDLAVFRARHCNATIVLGSATPSLETLENTRRGRYALLELKVRVDDRPMPKVELVDLRVHRPRQAGVEPPILSEPLKTAMAETLARGQQVILFLNRRGHSTFLVCEVCGDPLRCQACDVSLTHHLSMRRVTCHYCGTSLPKPPGCLGCGGKLLELGAGTEKVEGEVAEAFPQARVARLDRDSATNAERLTELLASFARRELDILVGTQMVAKGHDFPGVTLVCVVLADTALGLPDFRAAERTFQLLAQVGGRAGRGKDEGRVLVQTYNPETEAVARVVAHDFAGFSEQELRWRKQLAYPPYTRMVAVRIEGANPDETARVAKQIGARVAKKLPPPSHGVRLLGPAPAPVTKIKGQTRWQLLMKGPTHASLAPLAAEVEALQAELPRSVKVTIDVDPVGML